MGLRVPISFSFPVCSHPLLTPVNRSGDPKSRACLLQKRPGASEPRECPWVYK